MKRFSFIIALVFAMLCSCSNTEETTSQTSNRGERRYIAQGNEQFAKGNYEDAMNSYREALKENPQSPEALFNNGVATMAVARERMIKGKKDAEQDSTTMKLMDEAVQSYSAVAMMRGRATPIAAYACYNIGNNYFLTEKLDEAEASYRNALRLMPNFNEARRNLRITQLKKQENQQQNKDKNQNKDQNKDQDKDKNKDKDKDKDQNNQAQNKNQQQQQQQQPQENMNQQTANSILNANENKEQGIRSRIDLQNRQRKGESGRRGKNW